MLGAALALFSATTFALNTVIVRRGVLTGSVAQAMAISLPVGTLFFAVVALFTGSLAVLPTLPPPALGWLVLAGVIHFAWGRYCNYRTVKAIGSNLAGPVQQSSVLVAALLAIFWLGERLTPLTVVGFVLVIVGPIVALHRSSRKPAADPARPTFQPRLLEGYSFALLSATGFGVSPVLVRQALDTRGFAASIAGGLVSYASATAVIVLLLLLPAQRRHALAVERGIARWFSVAALLVGISQLARYMALTVAPVTVVAPIQRLSVVFRLLFSWFLNRDHEVFTIWMLTGVLLSFTGAALLSLEVDRVVGLLPAAWQPAARWHWP